MHTRRETYLIASRLIPFLTAIPAIGASAQRNGGSGASAPLILPFTLASGRSSLLIRARINRRDAILIVDTGSTHTILRPTATGVNPTELASPRVDAGIVGDAVGQEVIPEMGPHVPRRRVSVMDLSRVLSVYEEKIDGLPGIDFLMDFSRTVIKLKDRVITFVC